MTTEEAKQALISAIRTYRIHRMREDDRLKEILDALEPPPLPEVAEIDSNDT